MKIRTLTLIIAGILSTISLFGQYDKQQFFYRGRQFLIEGKYVQAIENFNILSQLDTTLYDAYFFRGIAKYNLGDFLGAQIDFDKTLSINPLYTPAYHYRAITLSRTGKYDLALKDLEEAVDLRPGYTGLYFSRGVTYFLSQQFDKAVQDFNRFLRFEPKVPDAYLNRGASYLFLGDTLKALGDYNTAISLNRFDPEGYIRRSRIHVLRNDNEKAIDDLNLDSTNSFALFNRALVRYNSKDIMGALGDLEKVLTFDPGNALTLYNRALIRSQIGDYNNALEDYDRVISINPNNVLAYYNRAALFMQLGRNRDAMDDYSQAINLYPDFANAYINRSYVKNQLGQYNSAKSDYEIAQKKIRDYKSRVGDTTLASALADTAKKFDRLLTLDADFAKKDFSNELLQYKDVDIRLKPLFKFRAAPEGEMLMALENRYEDKDMQNFISSLPLPVRLTSTQPAIEPKLLQEMRQLVDGLLKNRTEGKSLFAKALIESGGKQFNTALDNYNRAIGLEPEQTFYYINRGALQSEMIDFISSIESNVQVLTLDNAGATRAKVQDQTTRSYDYTPAIHDMKKAAGLSPKFPYTYYNLGNLYCMSNDIPEAIVQYTKAIDLYPGFGEAYYNRGLVLIYLRDKEKGCIDLSKAGELGVKDAYPVIKKYCVKEQP